MGLNCSFSLVCLLSIGIHLFLFTGAGFTSQSAFDLDPHLRAFNGGIPFASKSYPRDLVVASAFNVKIITNDYLPLLASIKKETGQSMALKVLPYRSSSLISEMSRDDPFLVLSYHSLKRVSGKKSFEKYDKIASLVLNHSKGYRAVLCRQTAGAGATKNNGRKTIGKISRISIPSRHSAGWMEILRISKSQDGSPYLNEIVDSSSPVECNGHFPALKALFDGKVTYACVSDVAYRKARSEGVDTSGFEIVYTSPFIEYGSFYVPASLSSAEREEVRGALLTFKVKTGAGVIMEFGPGGK